MNNKHKKKHALHLHSTVFFTIIKKKWTVKLFHHQLEKLQLNLVKFSPNFEFDD